MPSGRFRRPVLVAGLLTLSAIAAGCTGRGGGPGEVPWGSQTAVAQVGKMLKVYRNGLKPPTKGAKDLPIYQGAPVPPPRGTKDLLPMAKGFPLAVGAIRQGDVLLFWNTPLSDASDAPETILAYERAAPEQGGEVLMQDGSVRKMTPDQFRSAKKPSGAKTEDAMPPSASEAKRRR